MKKNRKLSTAMMFASTGAIICTGSGVLANDSRADRDGAVERTQIYQTEQTTEIRSDASGEQLGDSGWKIINEPSGTERRTQSTWQSSGMQARHFGAVQKASDLIGMEVRNQQNEKLGDVKDVMVDLHSGKIPFAILSTEGMGDRLIAVPPSALSARQGGQRLVLNMDRERLRSAPSFERNRWPDMANQQWGSDVYRFYGAQPYWQTGSYQGGQQYRSEIYNESTIQEPSGAQWEQGGGWNSDRNYGADMEAEGITRLDDVSGNRVRGGSVDLQPFAARNEGFRTDSSMAPHGATRGGYQYRETYQQRDTQRDMYRGAQQYDRQSFNAGTGISSMGRLHKVSELTGMNIKNAQNETVGEIRDVVLDLESGQVAYAVVSADRFLDTRNEFVAVPPNLFTYGGDGRTVTLNANRNVLMNAPRFERNNWNQVSNEQFVSRVYSHYGQQPYWQARGFQQGTQFREPSGAEFEQQYQQEYQQQEFQQQPAFEQDQLQEQDSTFQQQQGITDPAGAQPRDLELQQEADPAIQEPSGAQPQSDLRSDDSSAPSGIEPVPQQEQFQPGQEQDLSDPAGIENRDLQGQEPERAISEPSGAQPQSQIAPEESSSAELDSSEAQTGAPSAGFEADSSAVESEPAGAQVESQTEIHAKDAQQESTSVQSEAESSITSEPAGAGLQSETETQQVDEAAGAAPATSATATSQDQTQQIEQQVGDSLRRDAGLQAEKVQVTAENGKVVLRGTVSSEAEKQQIEQKVQEVILDNQIRVEQPSQGEFQSQP